MSTDNATTQFPKVGDDGIVSHVVNISGQRSPYTKMEPKKGFSKDDAAADPKDKANKGRTMIRNAQGPRPSIQAKICYPNSGESAKVQRNVKRVQGPYSFELARAQAQNTGNV